MISSFDKCLFVHIPKVAGQSIELAFLNRAKLSWQQRGDFLLRQNSEPSLGPPRLAHLTAQEYYQLGYISQQSFESLYSFSFVRNPWDRLVSEYLYRKYPFSFNDFITKDFPTASDDNYEKGLDAYRHIMPQYKFLYDEEGKLLVNFVGKFENLKDDFHQVSKNIVGEPVDLPYKNKTKINLNPLKKISQMLLPTNPKIHYSEYYDSDLIQWVHDHYAKDIALFDYKFD